MPSLPHTSSSSHTSTSSNPNTPAQITRQRGSASSSASSTTGTSSPTDSSVKVGGIPAGLKSANGAAQSSSSAHSGTSSVQHPSPSSSDSSTSSPASSKEQRGSSSTSTSATGSSADGVANPYIAHGSGAAAQQYVYRGDPAKVNSPTSPARYARSDVSPVVTSSVGKSGGHNSVSGSGAPVALSIPALGLNHSIRAIGASGNVVTPVAGEIGWYVGSPQPGKAGITVLLGHVTEYGPDVFYNLNNLPTGSTVTIRQENGGIHTYRVTQKFSEDKNTVQHDQRVWGSSATSKLALVTCDKYSGWENASHHKNNLVVILDMVS